MDSLLPPQAPAHEFVVRGISLALFTARAALFLWRLLRHRLRFCTAAALSSVVAKIHDSARGFASAVRAVVGRPLSGGSERSDEVASMVARELAARQDRYMMTTISLLGNVSLVLGALNGLLPNSVKENVLLMLMTSSFCAMPRLLICMACLNLPQVVLWNSISVVLTCYRYANIYKTPLDVGDGAMVELGIEQCITYEVLVYLLVIICTMLYTNLVHSEVSHGAQATKLRRDGEATTRMLELVCDVVVELDAELAIKDNAMRFAAMLSLNPQNVQGTCLQEYMMHDDDRQRFEQQLHAAKGDAEGSLPGVMHVTLRDGCGASISAEIFYLHFRNSGGEDRFLAGIQETPDHRPLAELKTPAPSRRLPSRLSERLGDDAEGVGGSAVSSTHVVEGRSCSRTSESISTKSLMMQRCCRTTKRAEDLSLLGCLLTWNVAVRTSCCCAYHGYIDEASRSLSRLHSRRCLRTFCPAWDAQCEHCGLFAVWERDGQSQIAQECAGCHTASVRSIKNRMRL